TRRRRHEDSMAGSKAKSPEARDSELLGRIAAGSEEALSALVHRYRDRFFAVARRMLSDDGDAEDAVQLAFFPIFRHPGAYRDEWSGSTWLYRILTNVCIDQWRKRRPVAEVTESLVDPATIRGGGESIDVDRALGKLPAEARAILVLCYVEE